MALQLKAAGNGVANDTIDVENWLRQCNAEKKIGVADGGIYLIDPIQMFGLQQLHIEVHNDARFKGTKSFQNFTGDGRRGQTFVVTDFVLHHAASRSPGILRAGKYDNTGKDIYLTKNTHYSVVENVITMLGNHVIAPDEVMHIVSSEAMLGLISGAGRPQLSWEGGTIDCSERGALGSQASGSGIVFNNWKRADFARVHLYGADDFVSAYNKGVADSGLTPFQCDTVGIYNCLLQGWSDLGVYATGGGKVGPEDNSLGLIMQGNTFLACAAAWKASRGCRNVLASDNVYEKCWHGGMLWGHNVETVRGVIKGETFRRCGVTAIGAWGQVGGQLTNNTIIDMGYLPDGRTGAETHWWGAPLVAIDIAGSTGVLASNNVVRWDELPPKPGYVGMRNRERVLDGVLKQPTDNTLHSNKIFDCAKGIEETGEGNGTNRYRDNEFVRVIEHLPGVPTASKSSGAYAPLLTSRRNVTSALVKDDNLRFYRQDDMVHVFGAVLMAPDTMNAFSEVLIPLPIPSDLSEATSLLSGTASDGSRQHGMVSGHNSAGGSYARLRVLSTSRRREFAVHFSYPVVAKVGTDFSDPAP